MSYRTATASDVDAIAHLHADSWRRHYRGAFSDVFLDGDVFADRERVWTGRLTPGSAAEIVVVAERGDEVVGFACTVLDADPSMGALLDNLHVTHGLKRRGIGAGLMTESAGLLLERRPASGLYLTVLEQNTAAQAFYEAQSGVRVERRIGGPFPGGGTAPVFVYAWPDPSSLLDPS